MGTSRLRTPSGARLYVAGPRRRPGRAMATSKKFGEPKKVSRGRQKFFAQGIAMVNPAWPAYSRARRRASLSLRPRLSSGGKPPPVAFDGTGDGRMRSTDMADVTLARPRAHRSNIARYRKPAHGDLERAFIERRLNEEKKRPKRSSRSRFLQATVPLRRAAMFDVDVFVRGATRRSSPTTPGSATRHRTRESAPDFRNALRGEGNALRRLLERHAAVFPRAA